MLDKSARKGVLWNTLGSSMFGLNSFIMLAMVSRIGTVEQAGYFGIAFTTAQILYIVGLFGVSQYQMTDYNGKYRFRDYAIVRSASCIIAMLCCAGVILLLHFSGEKTLYTIVLTILMIVNDVGDLYQSMFFQKNRLDLSGSALFYRTFWPLLLFCILVVLTHNILLALIVQIIANIAITMYYRIHIVPRFKENRNYSSPGACRLALECLPLLVSLLIMNIIINASKYGVDFWLDDLAQGYYNMIFMPAQVINLCSQFLFKPFLNQYSIHLRNQMYNKFGALLIRQSIYVLSLTGVCCVCAYLLGTPVLGILYHKDLSGFELPLTMVVLGGGIFALCQLFYYLFVLMRKQKYVLSIYIIAIGFVLFSAKPLIKTFGLLGAVLSFVAVHGLILLCYIICLVLLIRRDARDRNNCDHNNS